MTMTPVFLLLGILFLVFQSTLFHLLPAWLGRPDLLLLLIIFIALYLDLWRGLFLTLVLGMLADILSGMHLGVYPLVYLLLLLAIRLVSRNLAIQDSIHQVPLVVGSFLLTSIFSHLLASLLGPDGLFFWTWPLLLQNSVILGVICLPFFHFCRQLQLKLNQKPARSFFTFNRRSANRFRV